MVVCKIKATLPGDLQRVWDLVTNVKDYSWRSDLSRTEILNQRQFIEYTLDGFPTTFTVDVWEPYSRWEFHMESSRITGRWTGTFQEAGSATQVEFTEAVTVKSKLFAPFAKLYLKRQQARFLEDLTRALEG